MEQHPLRIASNHRSENGKDASVNVNRFMNCMQTSCEFVTIVFRRKNKRIKLSNDQTIQTYSNNFLQSVNNCQDSYYSRFQIMQSTTFTYPQWYDLKGGSCLSL
jgi:hypothetical protein